jgi:DNA-binding response OmpR family regulator
MDKFSECINNSFQNQWNTKVLLINSDHEPAVNLKKGLEKYGFEVYYFPNVLTAIQDIDNTGRVIFDMILCDTQICDTEYLLFAKQVRRFSHAVKIFLMSSCEFEDILIRKAVMAGFNEIIKKPISAEKLNIILQDYIDGIKNPLDSALKL